METWGIPNSIPADFGSASLDLSFPTSFAKEIDTFSGITSMRSIATVSPASLLVSSNKTPGGPAEDAAGSVSNRPSQTSTDNLSYPRLGAISTGIETSLGFFLFLLAGTIGAGCDGGKGGNSSDFILKGVDLVPLGLCGEL